MAKNSPTQPGDLLPSLRHGNGTPTFGGSALAVSAGQSRDGKYLLQEAGKHELAMQTYAHKTAYAISQAGELQGHAGRTFARACDAIDAVAESAQGTPSQRYVEGFTHFQKDQMAEQITTLYADGIGRIRGELVRSLPESAPQRGLLARLVGE